MPVLGTGRLISHDLASNPSLSCPSLMAKSSLRSEFQGQASLDGIFSHLNIKMLMILIDITRYTKWCHWQDLCQQDHTIDISGRTVFSCHPNCNGWNEWPLCRDFVLESWKPETIGCWLSSSDFPVRVATSILTETKILKKEDLIQNEQIKQHLKLITRLKKQQNFSSRTQ